jgi:hypothetical protein
MFALLVVAALSTQGDLAPFAGQSVDTAKVREVCIEHAKLGPGYFPFCHDMIVTQFGDADFRKDWYGASLEPFLTVAQASAFQEQITRVAAGRGKGGNCVEASLEGCLASLADEMFVTSQSVAQDWAPRNPVYGNVRLNFEVYPIPVLDELNRIKAQLERPANLSVTIGAGERVQSFSLMYTIGDASIDAIMRSSFPALLRTTVGNCAGRDDAIVSAARKVASLSLEQTEYGGRAFGEISVCGRTLNIYRFLPNSNDIDPTPQQRLTVSWNQPLGPKSVHSKTNSKRRVSRTSR